MTFWEIVIPALILALPLIAIAVLALWTAKMRSMETKTSFLLYGALLLSSLLGFFQFQQAFTLALETGLPVSSSEFELALSFDPVRMSWVCFTSLILLGSAFFDGEKIYKNSGSGLQFIFLAGASLFSTMAFLSEKIVLSIMFIEITVFLLHAFSIQSGGEEGRLDRVSYFKRGAFIFLGLSAMLLLSIFDEFNTTAIVLMGIVLYIMSLVFSKHNYLDWQYLPLSLLQSGAAFFLLGRLIQADMASELWIPLAVLFAVASTIFSALSLLTLGALNAHFWLTSSLVAYLLFNRFLSTGPFVKEWGFYEASGLLCAFALTCLVRYGALMNSLLKRTVSVLLGIFVMSVIFGVMPGIDLPLIGVDSALWRLILHCALTFLFATAGTKTIAVSFKAKSEIEVHREKPVWSWVPAFCALLGYWLLGIGRDFNFAEFFSEHGLAFFTNTSWMAVSAAMFVGVIAGLLLGANEKFIAWSKNRQQKMEDFVPRVDPIIIRWNQLIVGFPEKIVSVTLGRSLGAGELVSTTYSKFDRSILGDAIHSMFVKYSDALSMILRKLHSGSMRFYIFFGAILALVSAAIFLRSSL